MEENINNEEDNYFIFAEKADEMIINLVDNKSISLKEILNITENLDKPDQILLKDLNVEIDIFYLDKQYICFSIDGKEVTDILRNPLKIKIFEKEIDIVSSKQMDFILNKYYINPKIYCGSGKTIDVTIRNLLSHKEHLFRIIEFNEIIPADEFTINSLVIKTTSNFLNKSFSSPQSFEKNFNYYFKFGEKNEELKGNFYIFDDSKNTRFNITFELIENNNFGKKINYFGRAGIGKSVTLLGALKYIAPHKKIRTFYVNCKCSNNLLTEKQFKLFKKIIADEIIYLFYEDYKNYLKCFEKIKSFRFEEGISFWHLIDIILEECSKINKNYIIGFAQYEDSIDSNNYLENLEKKYLINNNNFKFIVISTMNEKDVRQKKLNLLFENINSKYIQELDSLLENFDPNFNENESKVFNKLGRTFQVYNEILLFTDKKEELNYYLGEKKKKYLFEMISFYEENLNEGKYNLDLNEEEIMNISEEGYKKFLSFKTIAIEK